MSLLVIERRPAERFPTRFIPLYTMVTFTRMPYADAVLKARRQSLIVKAVAAGLALAVAVLLLVWAFLMK